MHCLVKALSQLKRRMNLNENYMNVISEIPSKEILDKLSFHTTLERSLKKISLKDYTFEELMIDIAAYRAVSRSTLLNSGILNVRFKSDDSVERKYEKTIRNHLGFTQCFNDLIGIRLHLKEYPLNFPEYFRVVDLRNGKKVDDGYRAIHLYYQRDNYSYPIEIQLWCGKDYYFNLWSHIAAYKYARPEIGKQLYDLYQAGSIKSLEDFEKEMMLVESRDE